MRRTSNKFLRDTPTYDPISQRIRRANLTPRRMCTTLTSHAGSPQAVPSQQLPASSIEALGGGLVRSGEDYEGLFSSGGDLKAEATGARELLQTEQRRRWYRLPPPSPPLAAFVGAHSERTGSSRCVSPRTEGVSISGFGAPVSGCYVLTECKQGHHSSLCCPKHKKASINWQILSWFLASSGGGRFSEIGNMIKTPSRQKSK